MLHLTKIHQMKNANRTIKKATLGRLEQKIGMSHLELRHGYVTVSSYFGRDAALTRQWRNTLKAVEELRSSTLAGFKNRISN